MSEQNKSHLWRGNARSQIRCCKDCSDRHVGCHGECERYISEKKSIDEYNESCRKKRLQESEATGLAIKSVMARRGGRRND